MARIWPFTLRHITGRRAAGQRIGGGMIDRERPLAFRFNGELLHGYAGDTLASALLANGHLTLGRSAVYRRPRGLDATVLIERDGKVTSVRANEQELYDGLVARRAVSIFPWIKTAVADPGEVEHVHDHTDVLIIGSGPKGLRRAVLAAESRADVMLIERDFEPGGRLLYEAGSYSGLEAADWRAQMITHLKAQPNVRLYPRTTAIAEDGRASVLLEERVQDHLPEIDPALPVRRLRYIRTAKTELATGQEEIGFVFQNNDLPGIFDLKTALSLVRRYAVQPGERIVLYGNDEIIYALVPSLIEAGVPITAIVDPRTMVPARCHQLARSAGIPLYPGHCIVAARGRHYLSRLILRKTGDDPLQRDIHLDCDALIQSATIIEEQPPVPAKGRGKCFADPEKETLWSPDSPAYSLLGRPHPLDGEVIVPAEKLPALRIGSIKSAQERAGAVFRTQGDWHLATAFPAADEEEGAAAEREALAVRSGAGLGDISLLGKIDVQGPDAAAFLARLFGEGWAELPVGRLRHGILSREEGQALAGVLGWRLAPHHYCLTTAAPSQAVVLSRLQEGASEEERIAVTDITDGWGAVALEGPAAPAILAGSFPALAQESSLPAMGFVTFEQDELPLRLARLSLSGGAGYEIMTPAGYTDILWNLLREKGKSRGLIPVGTRARNILRIEAGHIGPAEMIAGATAAGLGIGSTSSPDHKKEKQLVGLKPVSGAEEGKDIARLNAGMTLYEGDGTPPGGPGIGTVTSACHSPTLGHDIALALLTEGRARTGTLIRAVGEGGKPVIDVKVGPPRHLDLQKERADA